MKRKNSKSAMVALLLGLMLSNSVNAEFQIKDWRVDGDGLISFDTSTGLEWLNLSQTLGMTINTITPHLDAEFEGFMVANKSQVDTMLHHVFPSVMTSRTYYQNHDGASSRPASPYVDVDEARQFRTLFREADSYTYGVFSHNEDETGQYTAGMVSSNYGKWEGVAYYDLRLNDDDYAWSRFWPGGADQSGVYLISQGGYSYSSKHDEDMQLIQRNAKHSNVSLPFGVGAFLCGFMLSLLRRRA